MRVSSWKLGVALALALVVEPVLLSCSTAESGPGLPTRYIRYHMPWGGKWIPESEGPRNPQERPQMVIWEVTEYPDVEPTPDQRAAAEDLRIRSFEAAMRNGWFDFDKAIADGFQVAFGAEREVHFGHLDYHLDDRVLDPDRPEYLMYYPSPEGRKLVGYMYYARSFTDRGPQIGGALTVWHYHVTSMAARFCFVERVFPVGFADPRGHCDKGVPQYRTPEMLHVWFVDRPDGPFATGMNLSRAEAPELLARLEAKLETARILEMERAGKESAR